MDKKQDKKLNIRKLRKLADMFHIYWHNRAETSTQEARINERLIGVKPFVDFVKENWRKL